MPRLRLRLAAFSPLFPFSSPSPPSHFAHLAVTTIELRPYSGMRSGGWGKAWSLSRDNVKVWAENQWYHWLRTYLWSELGMKFDHDSGLYWIWLKNEENRNMRNTYMVIQSWYPPHSRPPAHLCTNWLKLLLGAKYAFDRFLAKLWLTMELCKSGEILNFCRKTWFLVFSAEQEIWAKS